MQTQDEILRQKQYEILGECKPLFPAESDWQCEMFGGFFRIIPLAGQEPNWFWRWMQYLCFGFQWTKRRD